MQKIRGCDRPRRTHELPRVRQPVQADGVEMLMGAVCEQPYCLDGAEPGWKFCRRHQILWRRVRAVDMCAYLRGTGQPWDTLHDWTKLWRSEN